MWPVPRSPPCPPHSHPPERKEGREPEAQRWDSILWLLGSGSCSISGFSVLFFFLATPTARGSAGTRDGTCATAVTRVTAVTMLAA